MILIKVIAILLAGFLIGSLVLFVLQKMHPFTFWAILAFTAAMAFWIIPLFTKPKD
jgi:hypothetical protein